MASDEDNVCDWAYNVTDPEEARSILVDAGDRFVITVVYPFIMALGIVTNGALCVVVAHVPRMRTATNAYLINLAAADMTFLVVAVGDKLTRLSASRVTGDETLYGLAGCILVSFALNCAYFASIFIVTLVSVEKFYAVCRPLHHRRFSSRERTARCLVGAWSLSVVFSCAFIPGRARLLTYCMQWPEDLADADDLPSLVTFCVGVSDWFEHVGNVLQTVPFFIAAVLNTVLYIRILKTMHRRVGAQEQLAELNHQRTVKVRNQVARMLVANGTVFFLCQMLFQAVSVALAVRHLKATPTLTIAQIDKVLLVARIVAYLNAAVNAIVYNVFSSRYRRAFRETFCWRRKARRVHPAVGAHFLEGISPAGPTVPGVHHQASAITTSQSNSTSRTGRKTDETLYQSQ